MPRRRINIVKLCQLKDAMRVRDEWWQVVQARKRIQFDREHRPRFERAINRVVDRHRKSYVMRIGF